MHSMYAYIIYVRARIVFGRTENSCLDGHYIIVVGDARRA